MKSAEGDVWIRCGEAQVPDLFGESSGKYACTLLRDGVCLKWRSCVGHDDGISLFMAEERLRLRAFKDLYRICTEAFDLLLSAAYCSFGIHAHRALHSWIRSMRLHGSSSVQSRS